MANQARVGAQMQAARATLHRIVAAGGYPRCDTILRDGSLRSDLLVPRDAAMSFQEQIQNIGTHSNEPITDMKLAVCGLWPAFHFAQLPELATADA